MQIFGRTTMDINKCIKHINNDWNSFSSSSLVLVITWVNAKAFFVNEGTTSNCTFAF